jgi:hypothetical protein
MPKDRLLPYIRPVTEDAMPPALMEFARFVLITRSASRGPWTDQVFKAPV